MQASRHTCLKNVRSAGNRLMLNRPFSTSPILVPANSSVRSLKDYVPQVIYKNAGMTIFLSIIGGIGVMIYRTSAATSNFNAVKEKLQEDIVLVNAEQTELMVQNRTFTASTFEDISSSLASAFPTNQASYSEFVSHVQGYLEAPIKGGHYLDRVVLDRRIKTKKYLETDDVRFFMMMLSLVLETEYLEDRARTLFKLLISTKVKEEGEVSSGVETDDIITTIDYLSKTCQIPVEKRVIKGHQEYPVQTYQEATPHELLDEALTELKLGTKMKKISEEEFVDILLSNAVCAWGSCRPRR